jgi:glycosyltransferase involved in cell wall biosynthesis
LSETLISVNITTYNRSHILKRCIDSVLNQDYDNLEIVIVDDCSTDNTVEIVKQYQEKDPRIIYCRHDINKGLAHARNTAVKASKGEYIALMDDDDEWLDSNKLKKQLQVFKDNIDNKKLAIVCSSVRLFSNKNMYRDKIIIKPKDLATKMLFGNGIIYSPTVLMKKSMFQEVGGYDTNLKRGIDSDLFRVAILKYDYEVYIMEDITTGVHEYGIDRITNSSNINSLLKDTNVHLACLSKFKKQFNKNKIAKRWRKKSILKNYLKLFVLTKNMSYLLKLIRVLFH